MQEIWPILFIIFIVICIFLGLHQKEQKEIKERIFICSNPNCNYEGLAVKTRKASIVLGLILLCFYVLPGVLYFLFMRGYTYHCPKCNDLIR